MSRIAEIRVPDMGNFKDVAVIDVLVKPGDSVELETPLVTLETDKATMDVPSTEAGIIESVKTQKGGRISPGDVVATVRIEGDAKPAASEASAPQGAALSELSQSSTAPEAAASAPAASSAARAATSPATERPQTGGTQASQPDGSMRSGGTTQQDASKQPDASSVAQTSGAASQVAGTASLGDGPRGYAGPSVRKLARELGVDLSRVTGSGQKSRITHEDVKAFVKQTLSRAGSGGQGGKGGGALPSIPAVDFAAFGKVRIEPLPRIRRISAARLHASWVNLPHVTQFDEADITELEDLRNQLKKNAAAQGVKLTPLAFVIRACVIVLQQFPSFNASLDESGENLVYKDYINVGFAADTPNGLLVPVVRDAAHLDVYRIARQLGELSEKARAGKLSAADMQGGTFTVSSLGGIGGTAFTPIINAPEVAILGVSRSALRPVYRDGAFVPRLMLPLSLSYDHRVIDGAAAARFSTALVQTLAAPRALLEAVL